MKNTTLSSSTSADSSSSTVADQLEISSDSFWVRLYPDLQNEGKLVAKNYDRKLCLFDRGFKVPESWKSGSFVLVTTVLAKEKFNVVTAPRFRHMAPDSMAFNVAKLFEGQFVELFEEPSDQAVCAWLDNRCAEIMGSDEIEKAIADDIKRLEAQLEREEKEAKQMAAHQLFVADVSSKVSESGKTWFRSWLAHDHYYSFSDDFRVVERGEISRLKHKESFSTLLQCDRAFLRQRLAGSEQYRLNF